MAIDVQAAAAAGVRAYDMGGSMNNLCSGIPVHFAASSAEVVFDGNIPASCVTMLQVGWTCSAIHDCNLLESMAYKSCTLRPADRPTELLDCPHDCR